MAQCKGTTKAGARCKRPSRGGSEYCAIHTAETSARSSQEHAEAGLEMGDTAKTIFGFVLIGAIAFFLGGLRR